MSEDRDAILSGNLDEQLSTPQLHRIEQSLQDAGFAVTVNFAEGTFVVTPNEEADQQGLLALLIGQQADETATAADTTEASLSEADGSERPDEPTDTADTEPDDPNAEIADEVGATAGMVEAARDDFGDADDTADTSPEDADSDEDDGQKSVMQKRADRLTAEMAEDELYERDELAAIAYDIPVDEVGTSEHAALSQIMEQANVEIESTDNPDNWRKNLYYRGAEPDIPDTTDDGDGGDTGKQTGERPATA
jgi:hypothetical protein